MQQQETNKEYQQSFVLEADLRQSVCTRPTRTEILQTITERRAPNRYLCISLPNLLSVISTPDSRFPCQYVGIRGDAVTVESYYRPS
jgi:hypothetical protein